MNKLVVPLYSHDNGTLVIIGLVGAVLLMMGSDKKKKNDQ